MGTIEKSYNVITILIPPNGPSSCYCYITKLMINKSTSCKQDFFSISWGRRIANPPQVNLSKFGYMWKREVEFFLKPHYVLNDLQEPIIKIWQIQPFFPLEMWWIWKMFFTKKFPLWQNFAQKKALHVIWSQWTIPKFEELKFTNFS
jgi:hypothetical protein